ncbi:MULTISPECIES: MarR family winged helix-turn-helix transcriptional regulator [Actinoalloteichus]|uniref:Transcriptional regulator n=1 Tax=Actinoalloteichus fjordicus TaxID=1612552 RepID=A0AAC9PS33_9PSEU|nr:MULTISPECIES: MarR family winged helix-turn-helix transcriptional regulator [Actinoalloteichus]APU14421.1 transcriptional regulator [Actinoalloteichus fjordicus]APU20390.1 transcriptional regulator [Actinoalloteichus sp. GBA129-24]
MSGEYAKDQSTAAAQPAGCICAAQAAEVPTASGDAAAVGSSDPERPESESAAESLVDEVIVSAFELVSRLRGDLASVGAGLGLSQAQTWALVNLRGPAPMRELARALSCDPSNVTGIVDGLQRRGLVSREADPRDRRVRRLVLTPEGERRRTMLRQQVFGGQTGIGGLSGPQQRTLLDLLARALRS